VPLHVKGSVTCIGWGKDVGGGKKVATLSGEEANDC